MADPLFLTKVTLKNYKSIASCSIILHPLMFLVGLNGAGKSNFLDALRLVSDALSTSLDHAIRQRNGIGEVRRRSGGHPTHFSIRLDFRLPSGVTGHYEFRIDSRPQGGFEVQSEECKVNLVDFEQKTAFFRVQNGQVTSSEKITPAVVADRLYLVSASSLPAFRPVFDLLSRMAFYNLNPASIRDLQTPDAGEILSRDGDNIASVVATISRKSPEAKKRVEEYLAQVVPGVTGVDTKVLGSKETLEFLQEVSGAAHPWRFPASSMSDGTLRALGVLVALFQSGSISGAGAPLIGIEEPEVALHPAAVGALLDSLLEASARRQILITSHSADLLESKDVTPEMLLAVESRRGVTYIGPVDRAGQTALRNHLYTAGELLRQGQLTPERDMPAKKDGRQMSLLAEAAG